MIDQEHEVDTSNLEVWGEELDKQKIKRVEEQMSDKHDGEIVFIPKVVATSLLGYLLSSIEHDLDEYGPSEVDQDTHTEFAYAYQLHTAVHDRWNGYHRNR